MFAAGLFAGAAVAWNLESGVAVLLSLGAFIFLGPFTQRMWDDAREWRASAKDLLFYLLGFILFAVSFVAYLAVKSGNTVDLRDLIVFQQVFALTGFGMIPIPAFPHYWAIHAAIIFSVLFIATLRLGASERRRDGKLELAAYVAILGVGLTVYYVGRSHILVLRLVIWPSVLLLFFLLDRSLGEMKERRTICSLLALVCNGAGDVLSLRIAGYRRKHRARAVGASRSEQGDIG